LCIFYVKAYISSKDVWIKILTINSSLSRVFRRGKITYAPLFKLNIWLTSNFLVKFPYGSISVKFFNFIFLSPESTFFPTILNKLNPISSKSLLFLHFWINPINVKQVELVASILNKNPNFFEFEYSSFDSVLFQLDSKKCSSHFEQTFF
jgi:hypothetical protein